MGDVIHADFEDMEEVYENDDLEVDVLIRYPNGTEKKLTLLGCAVSETRPVEIEPGSGDLQAGPHMLFLTGEVKTP